MPGGLLLLDLHEQSPQESRLTARTAVGWDEQLGRHWPRANLEFIDFRPARSQVTQ